jgi:class 3 adenylate cyclase
MLCGSCQTVNPPSSRFCGGCGHSLANRTPVGLLDDEDLFSAERRFLTVVFCDLVGSTALSDRLDPEQIHELIQQYHRTTS